MSPDAAAPPGRPAVDAATRLAWIGVALAFTYLVFLGGASNFLPSPQARIATQITIVTSIAAWLVYAWRRGTSGWARSQLLVPGLVYAGAILLSAVTSSRPASSVEAVALLLIALPGYPVVRTILASSFIRPRLEWLMIVTTLAFLVAYLAQVLAQWLAWWGALGPSIPPLRPADVGLTLGTANAVAAHAELLAAPAAWLAWRRWRSWPVSAAILALGAGTLLISASRGAWLGTGVGLLVMVLWRLAERRGTSAAAAEDAGPANPLAVLDPRRWSPNGGRRRLAVAITAATSVLLLAVLLVPALVQRLLSGVAGRGELWDAGLSIWSQHPLTGGGPGSWPGLRPLTEIGNASYAVLYTPHSSVVQLLAETGLAGLVAALILVGAVVRLAVRSVAAAQTVEDRVERQVLSAVLAAVMVHSLVDPMFHIPAVVVLVLLLVARLEDQPLPGPEMGVSRNPRLGLLGVAVPLILGTALIIPVDLAMVSGQRGMDALDAGDPAGALADFDEAAALHELAPYRVGQGIARASLGDTAGAIDALRAAESRAPFTFITAQIAWLQATTDADAALATVRAAMAAGTYDPAANLNLAILLARLGAGDEAAELLATVFGQVPSLVHASRPGAIPAETWEVARLLALGRLRENAPGWAALLEIRAGLDVLAAADLAGLPDGPERRLLERVRSAELGLEVDLEPARADLRSDPLNPVSRSAFERLAWLAGSAADIELVRAISIALSYDVPPPDREIRLDGGPGDLLVMGLPRWPNASDSRLGPRRDYLPGMATIQLVGT